MNLGDNLFGLPIEKDELLRDKFMEPPFSILDTSGADWQNRKRKWRSLGIESELGRDVKVINNTFEGDKYGRKGMSEISIFDPALTELMYNWFCPAGGSILDPFAGGSVRGIVANYLGYKYHGCELRKEQIESNFEQAVRILPKDNYPTWYEGDSEATVPNTFVNETIDFFFTCPPYHDLEVYSSHEADLSNMPYDKFIEKYTKIINWCYYKLKANTYAAIVVGDIRDKKGIYRGFVCDTINAFRSAGFEYYNHAILRQPLGTAMLRANRVFGSNKKLIKVHEDVLIFRKS